MGSQVELHPWPCRLGTADSVRERLASEGVDMRVTPHGAKVLVAVAALLGTTMLVASRLGGPFVPRQVLAQLNGRIALSGRVVDQDGNPLSGVTMRVTKTVYTSNPAEFTRDEESEESVDGMFEVSCRECSTINLSFSKPGYYVTSISESLGRLDGERVDHLTMEDIKVVLEVKPRAVQLFHRSGELLFDSTGVKQVVSLGGRLIGNLPLGPQKTLSSLDSPYVSLICKTESDGTLARRTVPRPGREGLTMVAPSGARLVFATGGDGVVLYEPRTHSPSPSLVFREMREAPLEGYRGEIDFDQLPGNRQTYYFYCRVGGLYGKGAVSAPLFRSPKNLDEAVSAIGIRLNPDGSRNVTTHY